MDPTEITGSRILPASRDRAWAHLTSPESLQACIPGCERVSGNTRDGFEMVVVKRLGPVPLRFTGRIALEDITVARRVTLVARGESGLAGRAVGKAGGRAVIRFADHDQGCRIDWGFAATLEGLRVTLTTRPMRAAMGRMVDGFADRLEAILLEEQG